MASELHVAATPVYIHETTLQVSKYLVSVCRHEDTASCRKAGSFLKTSCLQLVQKSARRIHFSESRDAFQGSAADQAPQSPLAGSDRVETPPAALLLTSPRDADSSDVLHMLPHLGC